LKLTTQRITLELRHTFTIARGSSATRENVLVRVTDDEGAVGVGEAAPNRFYGEDAASVSEALQRMAPVLEEADDPFQLEDIDRRLRERFGPARSARAAVEMALHDLVGKHLGAPLHRLLGLNAARAPQTSFTIGIDTIDKMLAKVDEAKRMPILKIKVGVENDVEMVRAIRGAYGGRIRVDANCGWSVGEAIRRIKALEPYDLEFIEQPIAPGDPRGLRRVREAAGLPILTDESSKDTADLAALVGCVDGINIKLMKTGGLREALRMIAFARAVGWQVMLGCMIESSVAITAAAHISPLVDYADLDGALLVTNDPYRGASMAGGQIRLPAGPGLGVEPRA
jgi:L-alanine-DL-glutamate epimerase-like enolase superfamily enzyme